MATSTPVCIVHGCFHTITTERSSCNRGLTAHKTEKYLQKKVCQSLLYFIP